MSAKIIVLEGLDSSFKETNVKRLTEFFKISGVSVKSFSFPNYDSESSYFVNEYLHGTYGDAMHTDPYVSSLFYSLDRYDTWKRDIEKAYNECDIIILDRYVGSNIIYQGFKTMNNPHLYSYIKWIEDLEYDKMGMPRADITLFMRVEIETSIDIMRKKNLDDIHEKDEEYQRGVYHYCTSLIDKMGWHEIKCSKDGKILDKEEIFYTILNKLYEEGFLKHEA